MNIALETLDPPSEDNPIIGRASFSNGEITGTDGADGSIIGKITSITFNLSDGSNGSTTSETQVERKDGETAITKNIVIKQGATVSDYKKIKDQGKGEVSFKIDGTIQGQIDDEDPTTGKITATVTGYIGSMPAFTQPNGKKNFYILARDGDVVEHPVATNSVLLPPAARVELLVVGGVEGTYNLVSDLFSNLTKDDQAFANGGKSYLLATVEVQGDSQSYTYKPKFRPDVSCNLALDGGQDAGCTEDGQNINLDYFITHQKPYKIDKILPRPGIVARLPYCNKRSIPIVAQLKKDQKEKLLKIVSWNKNLLQLLLNRNCITQSSKYNDPRTKKRYFYFSSGDGKNFLKGFEKPEEAYDKGIQSNGINKDEIKQVFDGNRIDKISQVGDIEEWNLVNADNIAHVFHIHQLDFVVTEVTLPEDPCSGLNRTTDTCIYNNYKIDPVDNDNFCETSSYAANKYMETGYHCRLKPQGYRDVFNLPGNSITTVRIPFVNPFITGVFVYHCHILVHEDKGMMNNVKVINPKGFNEFKMRLLKEIMESMPQS
ncbi:MAG: multicopper oxidase domain-containing protein [Moorea sp. SIO3I6]|nr:multicopper oxidase domain-containing protein [Moorena sp. SIO3I6]